MRKIKKKSTHLRYLSAIVLLMIFTIILVSTLIFSIGKMNKTINFLLIIIYALGAGIVCSRVIEKTTHAEKKEILAGSLIPLPATIAMIIYLVILNNLKFVGTIDPLWASAVFFVSFNIPFLMVFYEHEKHKHHLVGFTIAPLALAMVYLFAYFLTQFIATDLIQPQVMDSFAISYEVAPVRNFVEGCLKSVAKEAVAKNQDVKKHIDSNLGNCIESFSAFEGAEIKAEEFTSSVVYGESTITVNLYYPMSFSQGNFQYKLSDFQVIIER